ncbi:glycoside hydrolase family 36 N-terminal domain-containing protein, partial [Streptomyces sp. NPDC059627]
MTYQRWTLRTEHTSYTVRLSPDGPWAELDAWGPLGVEDGPSALDWSHRTHFITPADAAPAEYLPYGLRPFTGSELVVARPGADRGLWWEFDGAEERDGSLRLAFTDEVTGLRTVLCYRTVPGTDVILRWAEFTATAELRLERLDSAAVTVPVTGPARLTYLTGQWSQEFQRTQLDLTRGTFTIGSLQSVPGHAYAPWLAVQDGDATYGVALEWPGNWHITAEAEPGGTVRIRAGRVPHEGAVHLTPGETLATPRLACACSPDGLDGLSRVWHRYERRL